MSPKKDLSTPALAVRDLWKQYKSFTAVDHISFDLQKGEILGLLGPNGAGKTTTIQMLLSTLTPTGGSISYFGQNLFEHRSDILQSVSFASTYVKLPSSLTVRENLEVYGRLYGVGAHDRKQRIARFLEFFGVDHLHNQRTGTLSAGQMTRVMLAKAFLAYPKVTLLDEPTASLDPDVALEVRSFVLEQRREYGVSVLFTSHNMAEVAEVCDRVMFLQKGKIVAVDTPEKLAASVSLARIELLISDGLKRAQELAEKLQFLHTIEERKIVVELDEHRIAELLNALAKVGVEYTGISINKPTLEDYFLQLARSNSKKDLL